MQKINLTDIIDDIFLNCSGDTTKFWAKTLAKQCALEFGKQLLELAAENAETTDIKGMNCQDHTPYWGECQNCNEYHNYEVIIGQEINKQSILDTIKQVE